MRAFALVLLLTSCTSCVPAIGRYTWHIGDSTAALVSEELRNALQYRDRGDAILDLATIPGAALGANNDYFVGRLKEASALLVPEGIAATLETVGLAVPRRCGDPDWVLVQLGTNDFIGPADRQAAIATEELLDQAIASLLAEIPARSRVLWVLPGPGVAPENRARLAAALARAPRKIEILELPAEIFGDQIHFGDENAAAMMIRDRLDQLEAM